jgi:hypothetical protein
LAARKVKKTQLVKISVCLAIMRFSSMQWLGKGLQKLRIFAGLPPRINLRPASLG